MDIEWIKVLVSIVSTVFIPIFIWWLNRKGDESKKPKLHSDMDVDIESAKEFEKIKNDVSISRLEKDRYSKKLYNDSSINFDEAYFFSKLRDSDNLVNLYLIHKSRIDLVYDSTGKVSRLKSKSPKHQKYYFLISYLICVGLGSTPYILAGQYKYYILKFYNAQNLLAVIELILFPILFLVIGVLSLIEAGKQNRVNNYVDEFNKEVTEAQSEERNDE
ncbi:hypothetical protein [Acinetobacter soli]|uniref:hypothetical protein n=1 Tax=Acinetobacter soli TaxID=487316 RepID=UPI000E5AF92C|nr:hypothetical protein [Acinetobacter soli]